MKAPRLAILFLALAVCMLAGCQNHPRPGYSRIKMSKMMGERVGHETPPEPSLANNYECVLPDGYRVTLAAGPYFLWARDKEGAFWRGAGLGMRNGRRERVGIYIPSDPARPWLFWVESKPVNLAISGDPAWSGMGDTGPMRGSLQARYVGDVPEQVTEELRPIFEAGS